MVRRNINLTQEQFEFLENISGNISEHIRRGIDEYIKKLKDENVSSSESKRREEK